ncbi:MAG: anthranilate synthase component I family protein, partial [Fulvivirga sp.]|nr:anthranilate synthase component I family protein [Fulvivirga sp.]
MEKITFKTSYKKQLADTLTPVSIYLRLRDKFAESILLESSDYHGNENSFSYVCCEPMATFKVANGQLTITGREGQEEKSVIDKQDVLAALDDFRNKFESNQNFGFKFVTNGLFGYIGYESVQYFEDINLAKKDAEI